MTPARLLTFALVPLWTSLANAQTWIVDDDGGPGIDFTSIQAAVDAAAPGDTIFVHAGTYPEPGHVTIDKPLRLVAEPTGDPVVLDAQLRVLAVQGWEPVVVSGFTVVEETSVQVTSAPVVLDHMTLLPYQVLHSNLRLFRADDVRLHSSWVGPGDLPEFHADAHAVSAEESRLEIGRSQLIGYSTDGQECGFYPPAGNGLQISAGSRVSAHLSSLLGTVGLDGGTGGCSCVGLPIDCNGGDGGSGARVFDGFLWLAGRTSDESIGHPGGLGCCAGTLDGDDGYGLWVQSAGTVRQSGVSVNSLNLEPGSQYRPILEPDPSLAVFGIRQAGRILTVRVFGAPGADAVVHLGRQPRVQPTPEQEMEILCSQEKRIDLGKLDDNGRASAEFVLPDQLPVGSVLWAQAEVRTDSTPNVWARTNSVPIVIHYLP